MSTDKRPAVVSAVVVAAGRGRRMESDIPKAYIQLHGLPILCHTLMRLQSNLPSLREIILVVGKEDRETQLERWHKHLVAAGATQFVDGGETRRDSVKAGLEATAQAADLVLVHDAVRPFFPARSMRQACRAALEQGGAVLAVPVADTIKRGADGLVTETVQRKGLFLSQTPQVFRREVLVSSLRRAESMDLEVTDDAQMVEQAGYPVALIPGSSRNIKITAPEDLRLARSLVTLEEE